MPHQKGINYPETFQVRLPPGQLNALDQVRSTLGLSRSMVARLAFREFLDRQLSTQTKSAKERQNPLAL